MNGSSTAGNAGETKSEFWLRKSQNLEVAPRYQCHHETTCLNHFEVPLQRDGLHDKWDVVMKGHVELVKIGTGSNLADALTKHVEHELIVKHMRGLGVNIEGGRHSLMPEVASEA